MARTGLIVAAAAALTLSVAGGIAQPVPDPAGPPEMKWKMGQPSPALASAGRRIVTSSRGDQMRYQLRIQNLDAFPQGMFEVAPRLPACGGNHGTRRSYVTVRREDGSVLSFACTMQWPGRPDDIWFEVPAGAEPPARVMIDLDDRQTARRYRSNLVPIESPPLQVNGRPLPVLAFAGHGRFTNNWGQSFTRYRLGIVNRADYPPELFAPTPGLQPCGSDRSHTRLWVSIIDPDGQELQSLCGMTRPDQLGSLWFQVRDGNTPPARVVVLMHDRLRRTYYRSAPLAIPPPPPPG